MKDAPKWEVSKFNTSKRDRAIRIVWDFDGTILPIEPYDSEQSLLFYSMQHRWNKNLPQWRFLKRLFTGIIIFADNRNLLGPHFKPLYLSVLKGIPADAVAQVSEMLATKIGREERETFRELRERGIEMLVVSCGTRDLSHGTLAAANILQFFSDVIANSFSYEDDRIAGMVFRTRRAGDKLAIVKEMGYKPEDTIVVGDGPTDIPLLEWTEYPVVIRRNGRSPSWLIAKSNKRYRLISRIGEIIDILDEVNAE